MCVHGNEHGKHAEEKRGTDQEIESMDDLMVLIQVEGLYSITNLFDDVLAGGIGGLHPDDRLVRCHVAEPESVSGISLGNGGIHGVNINRNSALQLRE